MALPPLPLINGHYFDFASIQIVVPSFGRFTGVTDISYSDSVEVGSVYGTNRKRVGRTTGQQSVEASMTMLKAHFQELIGQVGQFGVGYGEVPFNIIVQYAEPGMAAITDELLGVRITGAADTHAEGVEALRVAVTLDVMELKRNGLSIINRPAA